MRLRKQLLVLGAVIAVIVASAPSIYASTDEAPPFYCPPDLPSMYSSFWSPPGWRIPKEVGGGSILFKPSTYSRTADQTAFGVGRYAPDQVTGWQSPEWTWMNPKTQWTCTGDYPNGAWVIQIDGWWQGYASLHFGEDENPNEDEAESPGYNENGGAGTEDNLIPYEAPSGSECWAWVWQTYVNGVLVSEEVEWIICYPI